MVIIVKKRRETVCQIIKGTGQAKKAFFCFRFKHFNLIHTSKILRLTQDFFGVSQTQKSFQVSLRY